MGEAFVRRIGHVETLDGTRLYVGVDYDAVMIDGHRLNAAQQESFGQLFVRAVHDAGQQKQQMDEIENALD